MSTDDNEALVAKLAADGYWDQLVGGLTMCSA